MLWLVQGALGFLLFQHADQLVDSQVFRLSSGTAGFVALSLLIVAFVLYRHALYSPRTNPTPQGHPEWGPVFCTWFCFASV